jgi:anti-sigma factor RsiW
VTHQEAVDTLATERFLLDDMSDEDRQAFEEHFFSCDACADDLRIAGAMVQGAKAGFAGSSTSGRVVPMTVKRPIAGNSAWYRSAALPWAAAATLAFVAAYQSLWVVPSLRRDTSPVALVPVTLHPESRGREALVLLASGTAFVSLALEVNDAPQGGELAYDLNSSDGRHIVSGQAAAPPSGTPLLLLMPSTLVSPMHYILSVHDAAAPGRLLGEYRFAVSTQ